MYINVTMSLVLLSLPMCTIAARQEPVDGFAQLRQTVLKADSADKKASAYETLFKEMGRKSLPPMMRDDDPGIALQAAWEEQKHLAKRARPVIGRTEDVYDSASLKVFTQFVQTRTKCEIPSWWTDAILDLDVEPGKMHCVRGLTKLPELVKGNGGGLIEQGMTLSVKEGRLELTSGVQRVMLPTSAFELTDVPATYAITADWNKESTAAAVYNSLAGSKYRLAVFTHSNEKPSWIAEVWAVNRLELLGVATHRAEVLLSGNVVCVFGAETHGVYIESFDRKTGKNLFRFSTCYWLHFSEAWRLK